MNNEKEDKSLYQSAVEFLESIALFLAIFDQYDATLLVMSLSTTMLVIDLKYKLMNKEKVFPVFKKYFSFPLVLIALYILFGTYSKNSLKFVILLAGYAALRIVHVYLKQRGESYGVGKMLKIIKKNCKSRAL